MGNSEIELRLNEPNPYAQMHFHSGGKKVFTITHDAKIVLGDEVSLDEASAAFWDAVKRLGQQKLAEIDALKARIAELELEATAQADDEDTTITLLEMQNAELKQRIDALEATQSPRIQYRLVASSLDAAPVEAKQTGQLSEDEAVELMTRAASSDIRHARNSYDELKLDMRDGLRALRAAEAAKGGESTDDNT